MKRIRKGKEKVKEVREDKRNIREKVKRKRG